MKPAVKRNALVVLTLACVGLAGYVAGTTLFAGPDVPTRAVFVCVATGEMFDLHIEEALMIPAKNKKTGQRTLVPCVRDDDGTLRVGDHYRNLFEGRLKEVNRYVDPDTLEVRTAPMTDQERSGP